MHPTISQYAEALHELTNDASLHTATMVTNFLAFLKRRGESNKAEAVLKRLEYMHNVAQGIVEVMVVTAQEVSSDTKKQFTEQTRALFSDKQVVFRFTVDTSVIGGVLFRTEETEYDATIRASLNSLKAVLLKT